MSGLARFDRQMFGLALSEVDVVRQVLPEWALTEIAPEVVLRVARNRAATHAGDLIPDAGQIDSLCSALLSDDADAAVAQIEAAQRNGVSHDTLCLSYLADAARRLGAMWDNDEVSFFRVTIAASRIYAILRILRLEPAVPTPDMRRSAIFASVPGEQHTLGITMAADLARDHGWDIELLVGMSHEDLTNSLQERQVGLIGLSASGKRSLAALIRLIVALRISNPCARILICGQIAMLPVNLVGVTGADATARDFKEAIGQMERLASIPQAVTG